MNLLKQQVAPDTLMWDIWTSIYHLPTVTVADELGVFTCLNNSEHTIESLCNKLNINLRPMSALINVLVSLGFLTKKTDQICLTSIAKSYLMPDSPSYWGSILKPFREKPEHAKIITAIKQNRMQLTFNNKSFTDMWQDGSITFEAADAFTKKMHASMFAPALEAIKSGVFNHTKKLLDVGGGSGCFSIAFTQASKDRYATVFDLPMVCEVAKKYINENDAMQNVSTHPGNFFIKDNWPSEYDGVLLSQILHDWPIQKCLEILNYAYSTLPTGGRIYIHEMLLNDNHPSPLAAACFDMLMLINHQSQQFTNEELLNLLRSCGFSNPQTTQTFGYYSITMATKL